MLCFIFVKARCELSCMLAPSCQGTRHRCFLFLPEKASNDPWLNRPNDFDVDNGQFRLLHKYVFGHFGCSEHSLKRAIKLVKVLQMTNSSIFQQSLKWLYTSIGHHHFYHYQIDYQSGFRRIRRYKFKYKLNLDCHNVSNLETPPQSPGTSGTRQTPFYF